ncbi:MAG TPA: EF-hand domain-containing protein [Caulobacteraceae bacterium]
MTRRANRSFAALAFLLPVALGAAPLRLEAARAPFVPPSVFISPSGEPFRSPAGAAASFEAWFARVDTNHDGRIDKAEFEADAMAFFRKLDLSGDGVIDGSEIGAYEKTIAPELIARSDEGEAGHDAYVSLLNEAEPVSGADLSLDLRITAPEWRAAADRRFAALDAAGRGFLDHDALLARLPRPGKARRPREADK